MDESLYYRSETVSWPETNKKLQIHKPIIITLALSHDLTNIQPHDNSSKKRLMLIL